MNWRNEWYEWDVRDVSEVTPKLVKLKQMIDDARGYIDPEEFDYFLVNSPYFRELIQRQNRMFRALAREIRELRKMLEAKK